MYHYEMMTFKADNLVNCYPGKTDQNGNRVFSFDLSNVFDRRKIISQTESHSANALTYQIIRVLCNNDRVKMTEMFPDSRCLLRSLIYLDFSGYFPKWDDSNEGILTRLFETGFTIRYSSADERHYMPFDKSGSMSRRFMITFIDDRIFPQVDEAVRLGIPFSSAYNWKITITKYYAYRGLCLTDGIRIPQGSEDSFRLDESTVLVLEEVKRKIEGINCITAEISEDGILTAKKSAECTRADFDGEGLIAPEYASYLNKTLSRVRRKTADATSFQIRMPFTKGMLHTVDFSRFLSEQAFGDRSCTITDAFGIERDLSKVKIVLNASMFKCIGWLKQYVEHLADAEELIDPMKLYFDRFRKYDHALYIVNTDTVAGGTTVPMNYQFLNTIFFKGNEVSELIAGHIAQAIAIEQKYIGKAAQICAACLAENDDTEVESDLITEKTIPDLPSWQYAIFKNKAFLQEKHITDILDKEAVKKVKDICTGNILVEGAVKYLSDDLLAFLCDMARHVTHQTDDEKGKIKAVRSKSLRRDRFYVADHERLMLNRNSRYAILRSPHLSRNEHCTLRPFIPDDENVYNKYFSQLSGVLMLPYSSVDAIALGGADYDGDMIKLFTNSIICKAIERSSYHWIQVQKEDGSKIRECTRKYPIVNIPSFFKGNVLTAVPNEHIEFDIVRDTFSNQIGVISNAAVQEGMQVYKSSNKSGIHNHIALYTIATGVDIDAAKTGIRPNVERLVTAGKKKDDDKNWKYFYEFKEEIRKLEQDRFLISGTVHQETDGQNQVLSLDKETKSGSLHLKAVLYSSDQNVPTLCRLPGEMLQALMTFNEKRADRNHQLQSMPKDAKQFFFTFQSDEAGNYNKCWDTDCNSDKINELSAVIKAYRKAMYEADALARSKKWASKISYVERVVTNLKLGFDIDRECVSQSYLTVRELVPYVYADLERLFPDQNSLEKAIRRMSGNKISPEPGEEELAGNKWVTARRDDWERTLTAILMDKAWEDQTDDTYESLDLLPETKALLLSTHDNSFDLLSFFLKDIRAEMKINQTFDDWQAAKDRKERKSFSGYSNEFYQRFIEMYRHREKIKETQGIWKQDADRESWKYMDKLFNGDKKEALKHYWSAAKTADKGHIFFWDIFKTKDILDMIHPNPYNEPNVGE